jgi:hypothetical protein
MAFWLKAFRRFNSHSFNTSNPPGMARTVTEDAQRRQARVAGRQTQGGRWPAPTSPCLTLNPCRIGAQIRFLCPVFLAGFSCPENLVRAKYP